VWSRSMQINSASKKSATGPPPPQLSGGNSETPGTAGVHYNPNRNRFPISSFPLFPYLRINITRATCAFLQVERDMSASTGEGSSHASKSKATTMHKKTSFDWTLPTPFLTLLSSPIKPTIDKLVPLAPPSSRAVAEPAPTHIPITALSPIPPRIRRWSTSSSISHLGSSRRTYSPLSRRHGHQILTRK
jgi:hypothetical protein